MIKNLRVYACSHGKMGSTNDPHNKWVDEGSFGWYLSKKLNLNLINHSAPGASNFNIFNSVYNDLNNISNEDMVLVQWSYVDRIWCPEYFTIMPHHTTKKSKLYYSSFYNDLQEINKVLGYTLILDNILPNFYFNFSDGSELFEAKSAATFEKIKNKLNYLKINKNRLTYGFNDQFLIDGFHLTLHGQEMLASRYLDKLSTIL